ncbi:ATP-binding protein [Arthrobacter globiformis]|uniref:ATP-binding protein n=1 Tax=Arthrobacter globiformis TaxID=1665 RepID=UPI001C0E9FB0|nr:ATP-binding protein [Arthrobacter globiformis]
MRLRKTLRRDQLQPAPGRLRRNHAQTLATATVDRLLHHAHVCQTSGDSIRLTQALAGKGVTQLN